MKRPEQLHNTIASALDVNIAILDKTGRIVEVNDEWTSFAQRNGAKGPTGVGVDYLEVCRRSAATSPEAEYALQGILAVMRGWSPRFKYRYSCDSPTLKRWFLMTVVPSPAFSGGVVVLHQDDTEMKLAETRYRELLDSARAIIWRADPATFETTFVSGQSAEILGYPPQTWIADPSLWKASLHPDDRAWVVDYSSKATREGRSHSFEYRIMAADSRIVWLRNRVNVIVEDCKPKELIGISTDITERKQAEQERDLLAQRLVRAQEEERYAIARELHDDIAQKIALLNAQIASVASSVGGAEDLFRETQELAETIGQDVHRLSHGLHPSSLDHLGLATAVRQCCREVSEFHDLRIECAVKDLPLRLDKDIEISLFRVLQESLRNAVKHSNATKVSVSLSAENNEVHLQVSDNGIGFDQVASRRGQGLGLDSMHERLRLLRGKLSVTSTPGHGTQIFATVPLR